MPMTKVNTGIKTTSKDFHIIHDVDTGSSCIGLFAVLIINLLNGFRNVKLWLMLQYMDLNFISLCPIVDYIVGLSIS